MTSSWTQIAKLMGPTWGPPGSCRPQMVPMLAPWTLLSGLGTNANLLYWNNRFANDCLVPWGKLWFSEPIYDFHWALNLIQWLLELLSCGGTWPPHIHGSCDEAAINILELNNEEKEMQGTYCECCPWWRHEIETFPALLAICAGNSSVTG